MTAMPPFSRQSSEMAFNGQLRSHIRNDLPPLSSNRSSPSPSRSSFGTSQPRPSLTSHPATFGPPPTLEPPTQHEGRRPGSSAGSPHLSTAGWHSPAPSNGSSGHGGQYPYPEPTQYGPGPPLYYPQPNAYRSGSTEPDQYERRGRTHGGEVYPHHA